MAVSISPLPYKTNPLDKNGKLSKPWEVFFRQLVARIGGEGDVLSNKELEGDGGSLAAQVASLQSTVNGHTSSISTLQSDIDGLRQGPVL